AGGLQRGPEPGDERGEEQLPRRGRVLCLLGAVRPGQERLQDGVPVPADRLVDLDGCQAGLLSRGEGDDGELSTRIQKSVSEADTDAAQRAAFVSVFAAAKTDTKF